MKRAFLPLALLLLAAVSQLGAQAPSAVPQVQPSGPSRVDETEIRAAIQAQTEAWNHADIPAFMQAYEDSPDTTFIGLTLRKGFQPIRERYLLNYTTPEQMGTLTFNDLEVHLLPNSCGHAEYAVVTGKFHLQRTAKGEAKKDDGIFSLIWRKGLHGWKIILDHTS